MEILLALAAAVSYGVSDFAGGVLTRRAHVFVVFLLSQLVSFALLLVVVALWADAVSWPGWAGGRRPAWPAWWARPCSTRAGHRPHERRRRALNPVERL
jgi:drug/metabolite transporter (DMT)-like permease